MEELLKRLGLSVARGVPQMATGFVDLAALPFTMSGLLEPEQAVGSTAYLTSKGLLPPPQEGVIPETLEMVSGAMSPGGAGKELLGGLLGLGTMAAAKTATTMPKSGDLVEESYKIIDKYVDKGKSYPSTHKRLNEIFDNSIQNWSQLDEFQKEQISNLAEGLRRQKDMLPIVESDLVEQFVKQGMSRAAAQKAAKEGIQNYGF